jgi:hypothetical protein
MDRMAFWKLIELVNKPALLAQDEKSAAAQLVQALEALPEQELRSFDAHLQEVISDIDGNEYAKYAGISGNSDDGFRYLRQFVVGRGQAFYENVKNDPRSIPNDVETSWFEYLDLIAPEVWAKKTGRAIDDWYKGEPGPVLKKEVKPLKIVYRNDVDDVIALYEYTNTLPVAKFRRLILRRILPLILLIACGIIAYIYDSFNPIYLWIVIIILSEIRYIYLHKKIIKILKDTAKDPLHKGFFCKHSLEITEDGLVEKTDVNERKDLWNGVSKLIIDNNRAYIFIGNNEKHIINSKEVICGDLKVFVNEVRRMIRLAHG